MQEAGWVNGHTCISHGKELFGTLAVTFTAERPGNGEAQFQTDVVV